MATKRITKRKTRKRPIERRVKKAGPRKERGKRKRFRTVPRRPRRNCRTCRIIRINNQPFPASRSTARISRSENTQNLVISVRPSCPGCPCKWSTLAVQYIIVLTGAASRIRRKQSAPQLIGTARTNPNNTNPFFTVNGCTLTIKISKLNRDLRRGAGLPRPFRQGVPVSVTVRVKCNSKSKTIVVNITDP